MLTKVNDYIENEICIKLLFVLLIVFDYYFMYVSWGLFPPRNYLTTFILILVFGDFLKNPLVDFFQIYKISLLVTLFPLVYGVMSYIYAQEFFFNIKDFLRFSTLSFSMQYLLIRVEKDYLIKVILCVVGLSLFVALLQFFLPELGWPIRKYIDLDTYKSTINGSRPSGLAFYTLTLAEQVLMAFPLLLIYLEKANKRKVIKYLMIVFTLFSSILINNRGMIIGEFLILFALYHDIVIKKWKFFVAISIVSFIILFKYSRVFTFVTNNDIPRIDVLKISVEIIKNNFILGLGAEITRLKEIIIETSRYMTNLSNLEKVGSISPHNYFVNIHLKYGILGTLFNIYLIKPFLKNKILLMMSIGTIFNSLFHNGGFLNSSTLMISYFLILSFEHESIKKAV